MNISSNGGEKMNEKYIGALYLALAASIWGGMYVVVKVTVAVVPPLELVWMRYAMESFLCSRFGVWVTLFD